MVHVMGGTYWQGSTEGPYAANEKAHEVEVSSFLIAEREVTQSQWSAIMGANPSRFSGSNRPVDYVSWYDAVRFCNALSVKEALEPAYEVSGTKVTWIKNASGYRLPTEAEWEYAARGGIYGAITAKPLEKAGYAGGTDAGDVAWYNANSGKTTHEGTLKKPNELGLYDMSGNVWEWCWDWYEDYPLPKVQDPEGGTGATGLKVLRGGAWFTPTNLLRTTYRYWNAPNFKANSVGFRVARNASDLEKADTMPQE